MIGTFFSGLVDGVRSAFSRAFRWGGDRDSDDDDQKEEGAKEAWREWEWEQEEPEEEASAWEEWEEEWEGSGTAEEGEAGDNWREWEWEQEGEGEGVGESWEEWADGLAGVSLSAAEEEEWEMLTGEIYAILPQIPPHLKETVVDMTDSAGSIDELIEIGLFAYEIAHQPAQVENARVELEDLLTMIPEDEAESIRIMAENATAEEWPELIELARQRGESVNALETVGLLLDRAPEEGGRAIRERARFRSADDAGQWVAAIGGASGYFAYTITGGGEIVIYEYED
jgi:hypothetical protein